MAQPVYVVNDGGGLDIFGIVMIPLLVPPGYVLYQLWADLSVQALHPVFKIAACGVVIAAIWYVVGSMFRHLPIALSAVITSAYTAASYGWLASKFPIDNIWLGAITLVAGLCGFFFGRMVARDEHHPA